LFNPVLGLIPLGSDAEESARIGGSISSIDSLQATPLLFWAARQTGQASFSDVARRHTTSVLDIHCRADGGIIQSSELSGSGTVIRHFTHKGVSDSSVWGRAQAWGMIYAAMAYARCPDEDGWLRHAMAASDWWIAHVDKSRVAFWDFNDPAIPDTERDTAATAIACAALLKLALLAPLPGDRARYRAAAEGTAAALVRGYLTPIGASDGTIPGRLIGGCFTKRRDVRASDDVRNAELIFGSYYLFESLCVLAGHVGALDI
jgi:unsaturated chondroitin disaccharide hydrolase